MTIASSFAGCVAGGDVDAEEVDEIVDALFDERAIADEAFAMALMTMFTA
ncbi:hypothetical protein WMF38_29755 [Sorangium sp. So ce118]